MAAMAVFREHGFEGSSTAMLLKSMGIGRQSFYDTYGDKQSLYHAALQKYASQEALQHVTALREGGKGMAAIRTMMERVVASADEPCLGIGSICEFGRRDSVVNDINSAADLSLRRALIDRLEEAREIGELADGVDPEDAAHFVLANVASIRLSARAGASPAALETISRLTMRSLT
ncbi:TetR family transcriptional regulator [Sulfitobacter porphyrae]|nr:TetR family transcriptional regulator [Sulfitobacter porphyrae]